jgi:hypothetical protein
MKGYVLLAEFSKSVPKGKMALNKKLREFLAISLSDEVLVHAYEPKPTDRPAAKLELKVELLQPPKVLVELDDPKFLVPFHKEFTGFYLKVEQVFVLKYAISPVVLTVERVVSGGDGLAYLGPETIIKA